MTCRFPQWWCAAYELPYICFKTKLNLETKWAQTRKTGRQWNHGTTLRGKQVHPFCVWNNFVKLSCIRMTCHKEQRNSFNQKCRNVLTALCRNLSRLCNNTNYQLKFQESCLFTSYAIYVTLKMDMLKAAYLTRRVLSRTKVRSFLHLVKVNHKVNHQILARDWPIAWLTSWLTLTRCRKDRTLVIDDGPCSNRAHSTLRVLPNKS